MRQDRFEIRFRRAMPFHSAHEAVEPREAFHFLGPADLRRIQRASQHGDRFVIGLQRYRERVTILAAQGE